METQLAEQIREKLSALDDFMAKTSETFNDFDIKLTGLDSQAKKAIQMAAGGGMRFPSGGAAPETFSARVAQSKEIRSLLGSAMGGSVKVAVAGRIQRKAITTLDNLTGGVNVLPGIEALPAAPLTLADLIPQVPLGSYTGSVKYNRQKGPRPVADYQLLEGDLKKQGDLNYEVIEANPAVIAIWTQASRQALGTVEGLAAFLENELMFAVRSKEDTEILNGTGLAGHLQGIMPLATVVAPEAADTPIDAVARLIASLASQGVPVTGLILNPSDFLSMALAKNSNDEYLLGSPVSAPPTTLWGTRLVLSGSMPLGSALAGDFARGATLFYADQASVQMSSEDRDNFIRNLVTVLAEETLLLAVKQPLSFAKMTLPAPVVTP